MIESAAPARSESPIVTPPRMTSGAGSVVMIGVRSRMPPFGPSHTMLFDASVSTRRATGSPPSVARAVPSTARAIVKGSDGAAGTVATANKDRITRIAAASSGAVLGRRRPISTRIRVAANTATSADPKMSSVSAPKMTISSVCHGPPTSLVRPCRPHSSPTALGASTPLDVVVVGRRCEASPRSSPRERRTRAHARCGSNRETRPRPTRARVPSREPGTPPLPRECRRQTRADSRRPR